MGGVEKEEKSLLSHIFTIVNLETFIEFAWQTARGCTEMSAALSGSLKLHFRNLRLQNTNHSNVVHILQVITFCYTVEKAAIFLNKDYDRGIVKSLVLVNLTN